MLSIRGQADMDHYESRLKLVLGPDGYRAALSLLTEAAVNDGVLQRGAIDLYSERFRAWAVADRPVPIDDVLLVGSFRCAVKRRHSSAGANPARQLSLQPVAVGADDGGNDIGRSTPVTKGRRGRLSERTGRNA